MYNDIDDQFDKLDIEEGQKANNDQNGYRTRTHSKINTEFKDENKVDVKSFPFLSESELEISLNIKN